MVHSQPHLSILFVPVVQAWLAVMNEGRTAQAAPETEVRISGDTVETGQKGFTHKREAWEMVKHIPARSWGHNPFV